MEVGGEMESDLRVTSDVVPEWLAAPQPYKPTVQTNSATADSGLFRLN